MAEKRTIRRRHIIYYLRLIDRLSDEMIGQLIDISPKGIQMITESPVDEGVTIHARMMLPKKIGQQTEIHFDAVVLWCKRDINPNFFGVGCEFTEIKEEDIDIINNLIHEYAFRD